MMERCEALRLTCWNAEGVRAFKLQLEHLLNKYFADILSLK